MMTMRLVAAATATAIAAAAMIWSAPACAVGGSVSVRVIDRATGEALPTYWHEGRWWVAGRPGSKYAIALANRSGGRVLAVISVDGVNAVSGETAAHDQTGYVLWRGQSAEITGWRKNLSRVAAFEFTALPQSYAALTGRPDNAGVIGVAVFQEKARTKPVPPVAPPSNSAHEPSARRDRSGQSSPAADAASRTAEAARRAEAPMPQERIGTGHGAQEHSPTSYTSFERARSVPDEVITIHYDSRDNLVAMGVIPAPRASPNPFPAAAFVPDPPRH